MEIECNVGVRYMRGFPSAPNALYIKPCLHSAHVLHVQSLQCSTACVPSAMCGSVPVPCSGHNVLAPFPVSFRVLVIAMAANDGPNCRRVATVKISVPGLEIMD